MLVRQKFKGTGVAIITPFNRHDEVDLPAFRKLIDQIIASKVEYIVVLGTTGETPVLTKQEKVQVVQAAYEYIAGRVPVVVGIGGNNTREVVNELKTFPLKEADAVLSASPYYNKPSQEGIFLHYRELADASPKPILLYNVPGRTARNIDAATTLRLAHELKNIVGIKEASGDMAQCMEILRDRPEDFLVVSGDDPLALPQMACGMDGVISVAANAFPAEFSEMIRHCLKSDYAKAKDINDKLIEAYHLMFIENNPAGIKSFLAEMGMIENYLRLPLVPLSEKFQKQIQKYLQEQRQCSY